MKHPIVLTSLLLLGIGTALADVGRIPIFEPVDLYATQRSIEGHYYVTRNISAPPGDVAIDIAGSGSENIQIDLNGFTLSSSTATTIRVTEVQSLVLTNGTVERASVSGGLIIEVVGVTQPFNSAQEELVIENVRIRGGNGDDLPSTAIHVTDMNKITIRDNIIQKAGTGILVQDTNPFVVSGFIERNQFQYIVTTGIDLMTISTVAIRQNIMHFVGSGIVMRGVRSSQVVGNSIRGTTVGDGLRIVETSQGVYVANNTFIGSGRGTTPVPNLSGITVDQSSHCMIIDNVISRATGDGISINGGGFNHIEKNLISGNDGYGLHMDGTQGNVYRNNTLRYNQNQTPCTPNSLCDVPAVCDENNENGMANFSKENIRDSGECPP